MQKELLYEEYTEDKKQKFEIYSHGRIFDLQLLSFNKDGNAYQASCANRHFIDTFDDAKSIGKQLLFHAISLWHCTV